jgi:molybdopterin-guanine dinucleotide biosynthesis protein B
VEGMRSAALPRIICAKDEAQLEETVDDTVFCVSGIYADDHSEYKELPVLSADKDIKKIVDLIEEKVFPVLPLVDKECCSYCGLDCRGMVGAILSGKKKRSDCITDSKSRITLTINERKIKMVPFVQTVLIDILRAFLKNLKGFNWGKVRLEFDLRRESNESGNSNSERDRQGHKNLQIP